ncbi:hypothetical protein [Hymenobacter crusticola]|uniref:Uncharacterized protein n=1 Tax=Hymenobacter crusticola TaxID=1770526 RepID=A0A243WF88_9BACT|nr:hypothetical protein [Hymenobacter crusticola]OUJ74436.1 hypothetical protein BXP70_06505 [Hymenobacter crusticola]
MNTLPLPVLLIMVVLFIYSGHDSADQQAARTKRVPSSLTHAAARAKAGTARLNDSTMVQQRHSPVYLRNANLLGTVTHHQILRPALEAE